MSDLTLTRWRRESTSRPPRCAAGSSDGIVPLGNGRWTPAAVAHARIVARLRERGYSLATCARRPRSGRLAYGYLEDLFPGAGRPRTLAEAAERAAWSPS